MKPVKFKKGQKCFLQNQEVEILSMRHILNNGEWDVVYRVVGSTREIPQSQFTKTAKGADKKPQSPPPPPPAPPTLEEVLAADEPMLRVLYGTYAGENVPEGLSIEELRETVVELYKESTTAPTE